VGAALNLESIPISEELRKAAVELGLDPYELALKESDDYELIVTCSADNVEGVRSTVAAVSDVPVTEVGRITDAADGIKLVFHDGTKRAVTPAGWDHFSG